VVARASFAPGSKPGTADVIVTVAEEDPLVYSVDFNNQGSKSTGEYRAGAQFQFRNLFGQGDSTRMRLQSSTGMEMVTGSLSTRVPLGGEGWSADAALSRLTYELGAPYTALGARGEASTVHVGLARQMLRGMDDNLSFNAGYDFKDLTDVLELGGSYNRKHSAQFSVGLSASHRDALLGGGQSQLTLGYARGTLDWDSGNTSQAPSGSFGKYSFDASRRQALGADWSAFARATGQWALDNLDSSEKFTLTGPFGVRAFAPGQVSVDRGGVLALELRRAWLISGGTVSASAFYDYARGGYSVVPSAGVANRVSLHGGGVGLGWANGADLDLSVTAAWRDSPAQSTDSDRQPYIYFQVTKGF
jgi:hemolysin activation/secretion protein